MPVDIEELERLHEKATHPLASYEDRDRFIARVTDLLPALLAEAKRGREACEEAFNKGGRDGWMRCGVYHVDIDFEGRPEEKENVERRWPPPRAALEGKDAS